MTTTVTVGQVGPLTANGTAPIPFTFQALSEDEVEVVRAGEIAPPNTYSVTLSPGGTGSITPLSSWGADEVYIYSSPTFQQSTNFSRFGAFYPDQINGPLDRLARYIIAIKNMLFSSSTLNPAERVNRVLGWNESGVPTAHPISAFTGPPGPSGTVEANGLTFITPQQFGAVADNVTDDSDAFDAAFAYAASQAVTASTNPTIYRGGPTVYVPKGKYFCSRTWEPLATIRILGEGGLGWGAATQVRFPAGVTGIRVQAHNTSGAANYDPVQHFSGDGLVIHDIYFIGGFTDAEGEYHGIHAKRPVHLERCTFENFEGDGYYCNVDFGSGIGTTEGNTNVTRIVNCAFINNRSGVYLKGSDANAITLIALNLMYNRRWGIEDRSYLGNHNFGHHFDANGRISWNSGTAGHPTAYVSHGGNRYFVIDGQEAGASVNAPTGTTADNAYWGYYQAGAPAASCPAWFNGIAVRAGGPAVVWNLNAATTFHGCHVETNGVSQMSPGALIHGSFSEVVSVSEGTLNRNRVANVIGAEGGHRFGGNVKVLGGLNPMSTVTHGDNTVDLAYYARYVSGWNLIGLGTGAGTFQGQFMLNSFYTGLQHTTEIRWYIGGQFAGAHVGGVNSTGINLEAGKVLKVNGTQVVGAQGAAVAADATDLATALTLVNQLKARLRAHGLIA